MSELNVLPTVESIEEAANNLQRSSNELFRIAKLMQERNDISYAGEAMSVMTNLFNGCRVDLLVTRPIRALQTAIYSGDDK
jgi:hypothetical protein